MTASAFLTLKEQVPTLTAGQREELSALLHRQKQASPAWKREMARRMAEMDAGRKFPLSQLMSCASNA